MKYYRYSRICAVLLAALGAACSTASNRAATSGEVPTTGTDGASPPAPSVDAGTPPPATDADAGPEVPDLITVEVGSLPVVISAPHGGESAVPGVATRTAATAVTDLDFATYEVATGIQARLLARTGKKAHLVAARASRKYIDFNRAMDEAYEAPAAAPVYAAYHAALARAVSAAKGLSPRAALLLDVHGQSADVASAFRGTRDGTTADLAALYAQPGGFLTALLASGVAVNPASGSATRRENADFNGGFIVATQGLTGSGGVNAVQLELGLDYRDPSTAVATTARKIADALVAHLTSNGAL